MSSKVKGEVSNVVNEVSVVKTPEVKKTPARSESSPLSNAAVVAKKNDGNFQANMRQAALYAQAGGTALTQITPKLTPAEATQKADEIIKNNGGRDNLNTDNVGRDLTEIAETNPADAWAITQAMLGDRIDEGGKGKIKEEDKDEIAQGFVKNLNDSDIAALAKDENGRNLLDRMQHHLLSGSVHEDERADADRIQKELGKYRTFSDWYQGIAPHSKQANSVSYGTAFDPNASPEDAAAALKSNNRPYYDPNADIQAFTAQLEAHKNDAQWLQKYFAALGSDKTAELIGNAATPSGVSNGMGINYGDKTVEQYNKNMATIRSALETAQANGGLSQTDMNNLVSAMQKRNFNPQVAVDIFGKGSPELKESFVRATFNGSDQVKAAGAYVLGQMSGYKQAQILGSMSGEDLNKFVQGAMAGQTEILDMQNYLRTGRGDKLITLGGIGKILEAANQPAGYNGSTFQPAYFSDDLKLKLLDAVGGGLTNDKTFKNLSGDTKFKDELSKLIISQHEDFINNALNADGGKTGEDFSPEFRQKYSKLLQMTLFNPPLGEKSADLMKYVDSTYKTIGNDLKNLSDADFEKKYGRNRAAMARAFGEMTGMFFKGLDDALTKVKDDADKAAKIMDPLFKLIDFGIGKGLDKAGPIGKVISTALDLTGASDAAKDAIKEKIKQGKIKEALEDMKRHGVDISKLGEQLYEEVHNNLLPNATDPNGTYRNPDGTSVTIKDAWQNGYDHVKGAPKTE